MDIRLLVLVASISSAVVALGLWVATRVIRNDASLRYWARGLSAVALSY